MQRVARAKYKIADQEEINAAISSNRTEERLKAALMLGQLPSVKAKPLILKMLKDSDPWVRYHARHFYKLIQEKSLPVNYNGSIDEGNLIREQPERLKIIDQKQNDCLFINEGEVEVYFNNRIIQLTASQFRLLLELANNQGMYVSKEKLYAVAVNDHAEWGNNSALKTHIKKVRKKLGDDGKKQYFIQSKIRYGYRLTDKVKVKIM